VPVGTKPDKEKGLPAIHAHNTNFGPLTEPDIRQLFPTVIKLP
jgi:hypothetical protein